MGRSLDRVDADRAAKIDEETSDIGADLRGGAAVLTVSRRQVAA